MTVDRALVGAVLVDHGWVVWSGEQEGGILIPLKPAWVQMLRNFSAILQRFSFVSLTHRLRTHPLKSSDAASS